MLVKEYFNFSATKVGVRSYLSSASCLGAQADLDHDVSHLFPYINAIIQGAKYHDHPEHIQFIFEDIQWTLHPFEVIAAAFMDQDEAHIYFDRLLKFLNDLETRKDQITPNHKKLKPVSAVDIFKLLPQTNCRECGYSTCLAFAASLSRGRAKSTQCNGFSQPIYENAVYPVYNREGKMISTIELEKQNSKIGQKTPDLPESSEERVRTDLTLREIQVLRLVVEGATNSEISKTLSISPHTVKSHMDHIFNKLTVNDRTQAAVYAVRHSLA